MKRVYIITTLVTLATVIFGFILQAGYVTRLNQETLNLGFVCASDQSSAYTDNFIRVKDSLKEQYGNRIRIHFRYNIPEADAPKAFEELKDKGCKLIFATSSNFKKYAKIFAKSNRDIQVCAATADNANTSPVLPNYHTFMGCIYEGRYLTGVAAGLKLSEMINENKITKETAKVGYVAAMSNPEVISGYTAFFLGIRSVVPSATMKVCYTGQWLDYKEETAVTEKLLNEGCVIIGQHTDTIAPAVSCEKVASAGRNVYYVGYNSNMMDIAPTSSLISCSMNWEPYISQAVLAVLNKRNIESMVDANTNGRDSWAGLDKNWVRINSMNPIAAAKDTEKKLKEVTKKLSSKKLMVFKGDYIGVDPEDSSMIYDLRTGFAENRNSSAPQFHYILSGGITIENKAN